MTVFFCFWEGWVLKPAAKNSTGRQRAAPQSQGLVKLYIYYIIPLYLSYCVPLSFHNFSSKANISALSQKSKQRTVNIYWPAYYEISLFGLRVVVLPR